MRADISPKAKYRLAVAARAAVAIGGGYIFVSLLTIAASLVLPRWGINQAETMLAMSMASFVLYAAVIMAVFHARSSGRALLVLAIAALPLVLTILFLHPRGLG